MSLRDEKDLEKMTETLVELIAYISRKCLVYLYNFIIFESDLVIELLLAFGTTSIISTTEHKLCAVISTTYFFRNCLSTCT